MKRIIILAVATLSIAGCRDILFCNNDSTCMPPGRETTGRCFYDGQEGNHCANPVGDCPSGYRWDNYAGTSFANLCVEPTLVRLDGGTKD